MKENKIGQTVCSILENKKVGVVIESKPFSLKHPIVGMMIASQFLDIGLDLVDVKDSGSYYMSFDLSNAIRYDYTEQESLTVHYAGEEDKPYTFYIYD